jgi:protein ImuB
VLEHLVEDIAEQLQRRSVGATRLTCRLKSEDNSVIPLIAEVVRPVQSSRELLDVLLLRLEFLRIKPTLSVSMRATVAPLPLARQQDLFSPSEHIEPTEELASVVNRISNRLGKQSLLTAEFTTSPVPENSIRLRSIIDISSAGGNIDDRLSELVTPETLQTEKQSVFNVPLRLLPQPSLIGTQAKTPMIEGFQWNGLAYVVASVTGPDRIQTDWWNDVTVHRDYYRVTTQSGAAFWIYADLSSGEWYLHGVFD